MHPYFYFWHDISHTYPIKPIKLAMPKPTLWKQKPTTGSPRRSTDEASTHTAQKSHGLGGGDLGRGRLVRKNMKKPSRKICYG